jgi:DNA-binding transcriptional LysR family regulator
MLDLNDFLFFVQIHDQGGFTAASRFLKIPKSTLSHRMMKLEEHLGVRLLNRSPRYVGMTSAGRDFYFHAIAMLREAELAEAVVRQRLDEPSGVVRCTAGIATTQFALAPIIAGFLQQFPKVDIIAHATDRAVDLVSENFDVALRAHTGTLPDSSLVQRPLVTMDWYLFAGSDYLNSHGEPITPQELKAHPALFMSRPGAPTVWRLRHAGDSEHDVVVQITPRLASDDVQGLLHAAIMGLGIVALPLYIARSAVQSGTLRRVLPEWIVGTGSLTALIACRKGMLPSVRAFLDYLSVEIPKLGRPYD